MKPKLSVVIITKDEEKNIGDCLATVKWADEIVVIDNFSSDKTTEICRKITDKIFLTEWKGYPETKNHGIDKASGDWILSLDADERVSPELRKEIEQVLAQKDEISGYYVPRKNFLGQRWLRFGAHYPDYQLRLFKKGAGRFKPRAVHERVEVSGPVGYLKNPLLHYTYADLSDYLRKIDEYTTLEVEEMLQAGESFNLISFLYLPVKQFIWTYFYKKAYKEGVLGLILGVFSYYYVFLKLAKLWEKSQRK